MKLLIKTTQKIFVFKHSSLRGGGTTTKQSEAISVKVYDLLGREIHQSSFYTETTIQLKTATYILLLRDDAGNVQRERIVIE
jgi:hypothetical protein